MTCREVKKMLAEYAGGRIEAGLAAEVKKHLAGCPGCSSEAEFLVEYFREMKALPSAAAPADLLFKVRRRIAESPAPRRRTWVLPLELAGVLGTLAVLLVFLLPQFIGRQVIPESKPVPVIQEARAPKGEIDVKPKNVRERRKMDTSGPLAARRSAPSLLPSVQPLQTRADEFILVSLAPAEAASPAPENQAALADQFPAADEKEVVMRKSAEKKSKSEDADLAGGGVTADNAGMPPAPVAEKSVSSAVSRAKSGSQNGLSADPGTKIRDFALSLKARIVREEPGSLYIELPAVNYTNFLNGLAAFGRYLKPSANPGTAAVIRLQVKIPPR